MDASSAKPGDLPRVDFGVPTEWFALSERLVQRTAAAVTDDDSLRLVAGAVGGVLLQMADDPGWVRLLTPAEPTALYKPLTREHLLRIPWAHYLNLAGYVGPPPAEALAWQLGHAVAGDSQATVADLRNLLRRLGAALVRDAVSDAPDPGGAILHRIGVALWTIARVAFAAAFAAIVSALLPGLAPAAPVIAVVVHQVAPEVAKALAEQVVPDPASRTTPAASTAGASAEILLVAKDEVEALLQRWSGVDGPIDRDLVTTTQRWCAAVQGALFVERYHERLHGGDFVRSASDAVWRLQKLLGDSTDRKAVVKAIGDVLQEVVPGKPPLIPPPDPEAAPPGPPASPTPDAGAAASFRDIRTSLAAFIEEVGSLTILLEQVRVVVASTSESAHVMLDGTENPLAIAMVDTMTSSADSLRAAVALLRHAVDRIRDYDLEIGGSADSRSAATSSGRVQRRRLSLPPRTIVSRAEPDPPQQLIIAPIVRRESEWNEATGPGVQDHGPHRTEHTEQGDMDIRQ